MGVRVADDFGRHSPTPNLAPVDDPRADERDELAAEDAAIAAMNAAAQRARDVDDKAYWIRVTEDARAKVLAEKAAQEDFTDLYLDRDALDNLPAPEPLIAGILPRHSYGVLRGRDHSFKTFAAIDWALCLATGKPWQGHHAEQVPVLYVAGEGAHGLAKRVRAWEFGWNRGRRVGLEWFTVRKTALNLHRPGAAFDDLLERVSAGRYGLVVIDTLRRVSGAADGNGSEMGLVVDNIDQIKRATRDGSVLVLTHTDKHDVDSRGYSGIEDDADFVWHARRRENEPDLTLTLKKLKDGPDGRTINLTAVTVLESLTLSAAADSMPTDELTTSQQTILDTLREAFPDGAHSGQLRTASELPESTYYRALGRLRADGLVQNIGKHSQRPFFVLAAADRDSQTLPIDETPADLHDSHDSHPLPQDSHRLPLTPTTFREWECGSGESPAKEDTPPEDE